jgi:hypothetical protein
VDQAPLPSSGTGPDLGLISWGGAYRVQMRLPDELVHFSLECKLSQDCSESWGTRGKGGPRIPSGGAPPHLVLCPSLLQCSPAASFWHKGPVGWNLTGASKMLWQYSQRRNQVTLGGVNSDFNFMLAGPDVYLCLSPEQRIHRIFKRQCRASGYKECALP